MRRGGGRASWSSEGWNTASHRDNEVVNWQDWWNRCHAESDGWRKNFDPRTRKQELEDSAARSGSEACSREESNKCKFTAREETVREGDVCMRKHSTKTTKRTAK